MSSFVMCSWTNVTLTALVYFSKLHLKSFSWYFIYCGNTPYLPLWLTALYLLPVSPSCCWTSPGSVVAQVAPLNLFVEKYKWRSKWHACIIFQINTSNFKMRLHLTSCGTMIHNHMCCMQDIYLSFVPVQVLGALQELISESKQRNKQKNILEFI